ncbi:MAG: hypothetical protein HY077_01955 [Elusimicrobia bacterium]|nr:hypothetical protein [Elusimicrobiota bacterium]
MRKVLRNLFFFGAYAAAALAFLHPTLRYFATRMPYGCTDATLFYNNIWYFGYALDHPTANIFWTEFQYWPHGGNLLLQDYAIPLDLLAYWLAPRIGLPAVLNLFTVGMMGLSGLFVYLLLTEAGYAASGAFVSGVLFELCPTFAAALMAGTGRGFVASFHAVVPIFAWAFFRALNRRRLADAVVAALALSLAWFLSFYFFLGCVLLAAFSFLWLERPLTLELRERPSWSVARRVCDAALAFALAWVALSLWRGQTEFHGRGSSREIVAYVLPYLTFWGLAALRLWLSRRILPRWRREAWGWDSLKPYAATLGVWSALNWPMLAAVLWFMATGGSGKPSSPAWRGGGNPTDLAVMLFPSERSLFWGELAGRFRLMRGELLTGMFALIPLIGAAVLWRSRPRNERLSFWYAGLAFFFLLSLGPWLEVAHVHLYLPLPFWFLHMLPIFNNMSNGQTFNTFATLFIALIFAEVQKRLAERFGPRRTAWVPAAALLCVVAECAVKPARMDALEPPPLLERLGALPEGAFLPVPVGANFHIVVNPGPVGGGFANLEMYQYAHRKPYVGGFLARPARRVYELMMSDAVFKGLIEAQNGGPPSKVLESRLLMARYFRGFHIRYVVVEESMLPPRLAAAIKRWPLRLLDSDKTLRLFEVVDRK